MRRFGPGDAVALGLGLAFLYLPILFVIAFSFNASRLVTVWGGASTRWYAALAGNGALRDAAWTTLRVAFVSACAATVLGSLAAVALTRFGRFRGRLLMTVLVYAPMALPEVVSGLSLLLLFVAAGIERGIGTIVLAHTTLGLPFVTAIVGARLAGLDRDLEEAARDLGAGPVAAFLSVTLPLIVPALASGFLLAFTLSVDDLVIASFAAGPGATTLPMRIYSQVRLGVTPEINAASTLMIGAAAVAVAVATFASTRRRHEASGAAAAPLRSRTGRGETTAGAGSDR